MAKQTTEEHAVACLKCIEKDPGVGLRELRTIVGMTDREGDAALRLLRKRNLARPNAGGWFPASAK